MQFISNQLVFNCSKATKSSKLNIIIIVALQLHPDTGKENGFPFKRGWVALNSRLDVEMGVLNTQRGGETHPNGIQPL